MTDPDPTTDQDPTTDPSTTTEPNLSGGQPDDDKAETFPREYVEKLRKESAEHRSTAKEAKEAKEAAEAALEPLQRRLHATLTAATGRLADPSDLDFDAAHIESDEALTTAIDELLARKPHLAYRRVAGDVGQGAGEPKSDTVDLGGMLRFRA